LTSVGKSGQKAAPPDAGFPDAGFSLIGCRVAR
jgi:hypothetical protein